jgi:hypothetical protein
LSNVGRPSSMCRNRCGLRGGGRSRRSALGRL